MFSTFDLRLLLYVIRLAGWLKHCNLSLSQSCLCMWQTRWSRLPIGNCTQLSDLELHRLSKIPTVKRAICFRRLPSIDILL